MSRIITHIGTKKDLGVNSEIIGFVISTAHVSNILYAICVHVYNLQLLWCVYCTTTDKALCQSWVQYFSIKYVRLNNIMENIWAFEWRWPDIKFCKYSLN